MEKKVREPNAKFELLTKDQIRQIHDSTLQVFENPGVGVFEEEALKLFADAGCEVDFKKQYVKIPEHVLKSTLKSAPSRFLLAGKEKQYDVVQEAGKTVYFTTFGVGVRMLRYDEHMRPTVQDSTEEDLKEAAILSDWCPNIDFANQAVSARDAHFRGIAQDFHELFTPLTHTYKHFLQGDPVGDRVDQYFELAKIYYGGDEEMGRKRPIFSEAECPTSPLQIHSNSAKSTIKCARLNIPMLHISMAMSGATAPVFLAGTLVTHNAEVLAAVTLTQLAGKGAPCWYGTSTTCFDLRHGLAPVGSPELGLISTAAAQLAQYYNLPCWVAGT